MFTPGLKLYYNKFYRRHFSRFSFFQFFRIKQVFTKFHDRCIAGVKDCYYESLQTFSYVAESFLKLQRLSPSNLLKDHIPKLPHNIAALET